MAVTKLISDLPPHPARALLLPLAVMGRLGYEPSQCLAGTGLSESELQDPGARLPLRQELRFYRNVIELTGDPEIGLQLGEPFLPQRYGLFGYALLSAETFRHALVIAENFGRLTFSYFDFHFGVEQGRAWFSMTDPPVLEPDLLRLYVDRDMSAARIDFEAILEADLPLYQVHLPHDGHPRPDVYREHFGCEVRFDAPHARLVFAPELLDRPLPQGDPESSRHLQQQCQMLIAKLSVQGSLVDEVRLLILERPGYFPEFDYVAEKLGLSARTLRRRLRQEGRSYRDILDEVRFGLAREYLGSTQLPVEEISRMLGYSEAGNFSHAFRRWCGESPLSWRHGRGTLTQIQTRPEFP